MGDVVGCLLFKALCYGGVNAATVHGSVSRWNGMRDREGVGRFQNVIKLLQR